MTDNYEPAYDITTLTDDLRAALTSPQDAMHLQTQALDALFSAIMEKQIWDKQHLWSTHPDSVMAWMAFALRIQKQCMDTAKTKSAIQYMNGLNNLPKAGGPPPPPPRIEKRTIQNEEK